MEQTTLDTLKAELESGPEKLAKPICFYSKGCAGLILTVNPGEYVKDVSGSTVRVGDKIIQFTPCLGSVKTSDTDIMRFGMHSTSDRETALFLLNRGYFDPTKSDIILYEDYIQLVTPAEQQLKEVAARTIETENTLSKYMSENEQLRAQLAELQAAKDASPAKEHGRK
jgi:hypothetical protein